LGYWHLTENCSTYSLPGNALFNPYPAKVEDTMSS